MKTTLVALAALMISSGAFAQSHTDNNMNGVSLRLGLAFPLDNRLSGVTDTFSNLALEFQMPSSYAKGTDNYFAIDYYSKNLGTFGKGSAVPITYNIRVYQHSGSARQTYFYGGLGLAIIDFSGPSETVACARGGFGMNVSDHTFIEAGGTLTASTASGSFNTVGLYIGYRF